MNRKSDKYCKSLSSLSRHIKQCGTVWYVSTDYSMLHKHYHNLCIYRASPLCATSRGIWGHRPSQKKLHTLRRHKAFPRYESSCVWWGRPPETQQSRTGCIWKVSLLCVFARERWVRVAERSAYHNVSRRVACSGRGISCGASESQIGRKIWHKRCRRMAFLQCELSCASSAHPSARRFYHIHHTREASLQYGTLGGAWDRTPWKNP